MMRVTAERAGGERKPSVPSHVVPKRRLRTKAKKKSEDPAKQPNPSHTDKSAAPPAPRSSAAPPPPPQGDSADDVRDRHILWLVTSAIREAKLAQAAGDWDQARKAFRELPDTVPEARTKAVYWIGFARLEEEAGDVVQALDLITRGLSHCRQLPWEHDCLTQALISVTRRSRWRQTPRKTPRAQQEGGGGEGVGGEEEAPTSGKGRMLVHPAPSPLTTSPQRHTPPSAGSRRPASPLVVLEDEARISDDAEAGRAERIALEFPTISPLSPEAHLQDFPSPSHLRHRPVLASKAVAIPAARPHSSSSDESERSRSGLSDSRGADALVAGGAGGGGGAMPSAFIRQRTQREGEEDTAVHPRVVHHTSHSDEGAPVTPPAKKSTPYVPLSRTPLAEEIPSPPKPDLRASQLLLSAADDAVMSPPSPVHAECAAPSPLHSSGKARRVPVGEQGRDLSPEPVAGGTGKKGKGGEGEGKYGSIIVLQAIPTRPSTAKNLGSPVALSPVRRSLRIGMRSRSHTRGTPTRAPSTMEDDSSDEGEETRRRKDACEEEEEGVEEDCDEVGELPFTVPSLESVNYTYLPNVAVQRRGDPVVGLGGIAASGTPRMRRRPQLSPTAGAGGGGGDGGSKAAPLSASSAHCWPRLSWRKPPVSPSPSCYSRAIAAVLTRRRAHPMQEEEEGEGEDGNRGVSPPSIDIARTLDFAK